MLTTASCVYSKIRPRFRLDLFSFVLFIYPNCSWFVHGYWDNDYIMTSRQVKAFYIGGPSVHSPSKGLIVQTFDVFFDVSLNQRLKQTVKVILPRSLHCNEFTDHDAQLKGSEIGTCHPFAGYTAPGFIYTIDMTICLTRNSSPMYSVERDLPKYYQSIHHLVAPNPELCVERRSISTSEFCKESGH